MRTRTLSPRCKRDLVRISQEFAAKVYEALKPGATIIVTDNPAVRKQNRDLTILAD